jgi:protein-S-isoprenylcysteine O-methyltransferase Ste14
MKLPLWNIAVGKFFFRYRNILFPLVCVLAALMLRPRIIFGSLILDRFLLVSGVAVALAGQTVRLLTIGFDYIHRGGKDGEVYASRLVRAGVYGLTRNPMYLANGLIATGTIMLIGSPVAYFALIPFFLFVYQAIVAAEEAYLRDKFGKEYDDYAAAVNRFLPSLRDARRPFSGMTFDWRRSLRKDLSTVVGLMMGLILLPAWRNYFLYGWDSAKTTAITAIALSCAGGLIYALLLQLKKTKRILHDSTAVAGASIRNQNR